MFSFLKSKSSSPVPSSNQKNQSSEKSSSKQETKKDPPLVKESYIQIFNADGDTVFVGLSSGSPSWKLPNEISYDEVKYFAHINDDDGRCYYENSRTSAVTWSLPTDDPEISLSARSMIGQIDGMMRNETEQVIGQAFSEDLHNQINDEIDEYFEERDERKAAEAAREVERQKEIAATPTITSKPAEEMKAKSIEVVDEYYIQTFNNEGDPVFVGLTSGMGYWVLPSNSLFPKVKLFSHINEDDGRLYFEDAETNVVTWALEVDQKIVFQKGYDSVMKVDSLTRAETEDFIGNEYCEEKIQLQNEALDNFLEEREEKKKIQVNLTNEPLPPPPSQSPPISNPNRRSSSVLKERAENELKGKGDEREEKEPKVAIENLFYEKEMRYLDEKYIQTCNHDGDTVIIGLTSGLVYWMFPKEYSFDRILFFSHVSEDDGRLYFEEAQSGTVMWALPDDVRIISTVAKEMIGRIDNSDRLETEIIVGQRYSEDRTMKLNEEIDLYVAKKDEERQNKLKVEEPKKSGDKSPIAPPQILLNEKLAQSFNSNGDTLLIGLLSGKLFWTVPPHNKIDDVEFLTNADEENNITYEEVLTGKITTSPPPSLEGKIGFEAEVMLLQAPHLSRKETENIIGSAYNYVATEELNELLAGYLDRVDELKRNPPPPEPVPILKPEPVSNVEPERKGKSPDEPLTAVSEPPIVNESTEVIKTSKPDKKMSISLAEAKNIVPASRKSLVPTVSVDHEIETSNKEVLVNPPKLPESNPAVETPGPPLKPSLMASLFADIDVPIEPEIEDEPDRQPQFVAELEDRPPSRNSTAEQIKEVKQVKFAPELIQKEEIKKPKDKFMQSFNVEGDTVLIALLSGKLYWDLPEGSSFDDIIYLTHLHDDGRIFFEEVGSGGFIWSPPPAKEGVISKNAHRMMVIVEPMTREETELIIEEPFDEQRTNSFNQALENFLEQVDELKKKNKGQVDEIGGLSKDEVDGRDDSKGEARNRAPSMEHRSSETDNSNFFSSSNSKSSSLLTEANLGLPRSNSVTKVVIGVNQDEPIVTKGKGNVLRPAVMFTGYLKKLATQSGRNWKKRYIVLTAFTISYYENEKQYNTIVNSNTTGKAKGDIIITADSDIQLYPVVSEGFGFKFFSKKESITFAAINDEDRKKWMSKIREIIILNKSFLKTSLFSILSKIPNPTPEKILSLPLKVLKTYEKKQYIFMSKNRIYLLKDELNVHIIDDSIILDKSVNVTLILHKDGGQFFYLQFEDRGERNTEMRIPHYIFWFQGEGVNAQNTANKSTQKVLYEFNIWKESIEKQVGKIHILEEPNNVTEDEDTHNSSSNSPSRPSLASLFKVPTLFSSRPSVTNPKEEKADAAALRRKTRQNSIIRSAIRNSLTGIQEGEEGENKHDSNSNLSQKRPSTGANRSSIKGADALATAALRKQERQKSMKISKSILVTEGERGNRLDYYRWDDEEEKKQLEPTSTSLDMNLSSATNAITSSTSAGNDIFIEENVESKKPFTASEEIKYDGNDSTVSSEVKKSRRESFSNNVRKASIHAQPLEENSPVVPSEAVTPKTMKALDALFIVPKGEDSTKHLESKERIYQPPLPSEPPSPLPSVAKEIHSPPPKPPSPPPPKPPSPSSPVAKDSHPPPPKPPSPPLSRPAPSVQLPPPKPPSPAISEAKDNHPPPPKPPSPAISEAKDNHPPPPKPPPAISEAKDNHPPPPKPASFEAASTEIEKDQKATRNLMEDIISVTPTLKIEIPKSSPNHSAKDTTKAPNNSHPPPPPASKPQSKLLKLSDLKKKALEKVNNERVNVEKKEEEVQHSIFQEEKNITSKESRSLLTNQESTNLLNVNGSPEISPLSSFTTVEGEKPKNALEMAAARRSKKLQSDPPSGVSGLDKIFNFSPEPISETLKKDDDSDRSSVSNIMSPQGRRQSTRRTSVKPPTEPIPQLPMPAPPTSALEKMFNFQSTGDDNQSTSSTATAQSAPRNALEMAALRKTSRLSSQSTKSSISLDSRGSSISLQQQPTNATQPLHSVFGSVDGSVQPLRYSVHSQSPARASFAAKSALAKPDEDYIVAPLAKVFKSSESITRPFEEVKLEEPSAKAIVREEEEAGLGKLNALEAARLRKKLKASGVTNVKEIIRPNNSNAIPSSTEDSSIQSILGDYHSYNKSSLVALSQFLEEDEKSAERVGGKSSAQSKNSSSSTQVTQTTLNAIRRQSELKEKRRQSLKIQDKKAEEKLKGKDEDLIANTRTASAEVQSSTIRGIFGSVESHSDSDQDNKMHDLNMHSSVDEIPELEPPKPTTKTGIRDAAVKKIAKRPSIASRQKEIEKPIEDVDKPIKAGEKPMVHAIERDSISSELEIKSRSRESSEPPVPKFNQATVRFTDTPPTVFHHHQHESPVTLNPFLSSYTEDSDNDEDEEKPFPKEKKPSPPQPTKTLQERRSEDSLPTLGDSYDDEEEVDIGNEIVLRSSQARNSISENLYRRQAQSDDGDDWVQKDSPPPFPLAPSSDHLSPEQQDWFQPGYVNAVDLFKTNPNKPLVRIVFENYSFEKVMDVTSFQQFTYDFGVYLSTEDIVKVLQEYSTSYQRSKPSPSSSKNVKLSYEDFLIFWRNHPVFSAMKVNDKNTKRRLFVAYLFRQYDNLAVGSVKMNDFPAIYARLLETNYLNAKRHKITEIIKAVDPYHKGKIEMNRFMDWLSTNIRAGSTRQSTLGRIWSSLSSFGGSKEEKPQKEESTVSSTNSRDTTPTIMMITGTGGSPLISRGKMMKVKSDPYKDELWNKAESKDSIEEIEIDLSHVKATSKTRPPSTKDLSIPANPVSRIVKEPTAPSSAPTRQADVQVDLSKIAKLNEIAAASSETTPKLSIVSKTSIKPSSKPRSELALIKEEEKGMVEKTPAGAVKDGDDLGSANKKKSMFTRRKSVMKMTGKEKVDAKQTVNPTPTLKRQEITDTAAKFTSTEPPKPAQTAIFELPEHLLRSEEIKPSLSAPPTALPVDSSTLTNPIKSEEGYVPTSFSTFSSSSSSNPSSTGAVMNPLLALKQKSNGSGSNIAKGPSSIPSISGETSLSAPPHPLIRRNATKEYEEEKEPTCEESTSSAKIGEKDTDLSVANPLTRKSGSQSAENRAPPKETSIMKDAEKEKINLTIDVSFVEEGSSVIKDEAKDKEEIKEEEEVISFSRVKVKKVDYYTPEKRNLISKSNTYDFTHAADTVNAATVTTGTSLSTNNKLNQNNLATPQSSTLHSFFSSARNIFAEEVLHDSQNIRETLKQQSSPLSPNTPPTLRQPAIPPLPTNKVTSHIEKNESNDLLLTSQSHFIQKLGEKKELFLQLLQVTEGDIRRYMEQNRNKASQSRMIPPTIKVEEEEEEEETFLEKFMKENDIREEGDENDQNDYVDPNSFPIDTLFDEEEDGVFGGGVDDDTDAEEEEEEEDEEVENEEVSAINFSSASSAFASPNKVNHTSFLKPTPTTSPHPTNITSPSSQSFSYQNLLAEKQLLLQSMNYLHYYYYSSKENIVLYQIQSLQRIITKAEEQLQIYISQRDYVSSLYQLYKEEIINKNNIYYQSQQERILQYFQTLQQTYYQKQYQVYSTLQLLHKKCQELSDYQTFYQTITSKDMMQEHEISSLVEPQIEEVKGFGGPGIVQKVKMVDILRNNENISYHRQQREMKKQEEKRKVYEAIEKKKRKNLKEEEKRKKFIMKQMREKRLSESPKKRSYDDDDDDDDVCYGRGYGSNDDEEEDVKSLADYNSDDDNDEEEGSVRKPMRYQPTLKKTSSRSLKVLSSSISPKSSQRTVLPPNYSSNRYERRDRDYDSRSEDNNDHEDDDEDEEEEEEEVEEFDMNESLDKYNSD